ALASRECADGIVEPVFKPQPHSPHALAEVALEPGPQGPTEPARPAAAPGQHQVLGDAHRRRRSAERVLKYPADELRPAVLGPAGNIPIGEQDLSRIDGKRPG